MEKLAYDENQEISKIGRSLNGEMNFVVCGQGTIFLLI